MQITRSSIETTNGPADWFTGDVYIDTVAAIPEPSRVRAANVHFAPEPERPGTPIRSDSRSS